METDAFTTYIINALPKETKALPQYSEATAYKLAPTIQERVHTAHEITTAAQAGEYDFAFMTPTVSAASIKWKKDEQARDALPRLEQAATLLAEADFTSPEAIKNALWDYAEEVGRGDLLWPLRVSLTGMERSPDPFMCAYIIGKDETILRIHNAIETLTAD